MDDPRSSKSLRRLQIDLIELEVAFDNNSPGMSYYLDLETGHVVLVTSEARRTVETEEGNGIASDEGPGWIQNAVEDARRVAADDERYIAIPSQSPRGDYRGMQEFVGTVANESLRDRLWDAIQERDAFRRFRDILARYPDERERWFEFEQDCGMQRIMDWLADEGIEPLPADEADEADDAGEADEAVPAADSDSGSGC
jgi:hypothetical protein